MSDRLREKLGVCQWFHYEAHDDLARAVDLLRALGVRHLRTGLSWADFHRPGGPDWYAHQMEALSEFEVLLSVWHTPPSRAEGERCAGPPRRLEDYAEFIGQVYELYGDAFADLELWNEPNNRLKWDFRTFDPDWSKFGRMIRLAGLEARRRGRRTVLGGMIPVDHHWLGLMRDQGVLDAVDVVAIHAFPGMWWSDAPNWDWYSHWRGWEDKIGYISPHAEGRPIWVTETGLATWDHRRGRVEHFREQSDRLREAAEAPVDRVYWYSLMDLDPRRAAIEGFHVEENEYHLGLATWDGRPKPAFRELQALLAGDLRSTGADTGAP